jgi:flagellar basal-body rod protein FlgF
MSGTIYQAAAGALLQQMRLDMLSNNLANVNTTGFKADMPVFHFETEDPRRRCRSTARAGSRLTRRP